MINFSFTSQLHFSELTSWTTPFKIQISNWIFLKFTFWNLFPESLYSLSKFKKSKCIDKKTDPNKNVSENLIVN